MSFQNRLKSILGAENDDASYIVVTPEEHAVVLADNEIMESDVVVAKVEEELVQQESDIEQLEERVEDLEEEVAGLEAMFNGRTDWNPALAEKMYNTARRLSARAFGEQDEINIKGAECFYDVSTAQMELITGLEAVKENASTMWEGVKQFFISLYNTVINFFVGLFDKLRGVEKKADALTTKVNATPDAKIKDTIKLGMWNAYIGLGTGKWWQFLNQKTPDNSLDQAKKLVSRTKDLSDALREQKVDKLAKALKKCNSDFKSDASGTKDKKSASSAHTSYSAFFNGIEFDVVLPNPNSNDDVAALKGVSFSYKVVKEATSDQGEFKTGMNKSKLIALLSKIKNTAKEMRMAKFDSASLKVDRDRAIAVVEASSAEKEDKNKSISGIRAGNTAILKLARVMSSYVGDVCIANLKFVAAHV